jgi:hypothetical protein
MSPWDPTKGGAFGIHYFLKDEVQGRSWPRFHRRQPMECQRRVGPWRVQGRALALQPLHLINPVGPGRNHRQPVEPQRNPRRLRHAMLQRPKEILVQLPVRTLHRMTARAIGQEAGALLGRVGQLDERVGQFDPAHEQLEALRHTRIIGAAPRQRGLGGGPMGQETGPVATEPRLHPLQQQPEEQILPGFPRAQPGAGASSAVASTSAPT